MKNTFIPKCIRLDVLTKYPLNAVQREAVYLFLVMRDGEKCALCGYVPAENERLEIDHIDGNKQRHFHKNLQLLDKKCNCNKDKKGSKNVSGKGIDFAVCVDTNIIPQEARSAETALKLKYYPEFIKYLNEKIKTQTVLIDIQEMSYNMFIRTGGSDETFKRYAKCMTGSEGPFRIYTDTVTKKKYLQLKENSELYKKYME